VESFTPARAHRWGSPHEKLHHGAAERCRRLGSSKATPSAARDRGEKLRQIAPTRDHALRSRGSGNEIGAFGLVSIEGFTALAKTPTCGLGELGQLGTSRGAFRMATAAGCVEGREEPQ